MMKAYHDDYLIRALIQISRQANLDDHGWCDPASLDTRSRSQLGVLRALGAIEERRLPDDPAADWEPTSWFVRLTAHGLLLLTAEASASNFDGVDADMMTRARRLIIVAQLDCLAKAEVSVIE